MTEDGIEAVAKAFYSIQEEGRGWERESEVLREQFRRDARIAVGMLEEPSPLPSAREPGPLRVASELQQARDFLMTSPEVCILPGSCFRAVLRGPDHIYDVANESHSRLLGFRDVIGRPFRQALPELHGQGFFELIDQVYTSRTPFVGRALPFRVQSRPGAALDEHILDFVYRPIEDATGQVTGIFVEGLDRTAWARA